ncbi:PREDICTED: coilin isoform X2 [Nelumbo nucifera]|uniref:Coilin isoform X2 n=1 Tax=Nelumbo nucifera TaxID=4432 RepID=A0A1U7ZDX4_NELNU|nr:PREDICTED: coilin isoform X2 [Nelumbo nucifera]
MGSVRLRLLFGDRHLLNKSQRSNGLKRCWLLLKPEHETVSDLSSYLIRTFDLEESCPNGLLLSMDGFVLPPFESTQILKDRDIIRVKKKGDTLTEISRLEEKKNYAEDSEIVEKRPLLTRVELLAFEEFEKESGGYQSEPEEEEDDRIEDTLHVVNTSSGQKISKKRKSSKKIQNSKRKKAKSTSEEKCLVVPKGVECDVDIEKNESGHLNGVVSPKNLQKKNKFSNKCGKSDVISAPEIDERINYCESTSNEERCGQLQENDAEGVDGSHVPEGIRKLPSRSARRKKAKRRWLRELVRSQKEELIQHNILEKDTQKQSPKHQEAEEDGNVDDEVVPVVVRPGHIRFEPLGKEKIVQQNQDEVETFQWSGTISKKKGQKWGREKNLFCGRSDYRESTEEMVTDEGETADGAIDFDSLTTLASLPKEGDVIAYRLVELSSSWCPELSPFRVGKVSWYDSGSNMVMLLPVSEYPIVSDQKADGDASEMQLDTSLYKEDGSLEIDLASLVDVRVVHHDKLNPATEVSCGSDAVPVNNRGTVSGGPASNQDTVSDGGPHSNNKEIDDRVKGNGQQINVWEEISQALKDKKTQLLQRDGWTTKASSGKSAWSYKALRSSALGPTMALLRAEND